MGSGVSGEQPCRKGSGGAGGQQAQEEPAVCPGSQEGKPSWGGHQPQHEEMVKRGDCPAVFRIGAASPGALYAALGLTIGEGCEGP